MSARMADRSVCDKAILNMVRAIGALLVGGIIMLGTTVWTISDDARRVSLECAAKLSEHVIRPEHQRYEAMK
jgi:hypothetical protein